MRMLLPGASLNNTWYRPWFFSKRQLELVIKSDIDAKVRPPTPSRSLRRSLLVAANSAQKRANPVESRRAVRGGTRQQTYVEGVRAKGVRTKWRQM
eukprot:77462-Prorocentrum_minimum.AAC.10